MNSNISDLKIKLFYLASAVAIIGHSTNLLMETIGHIFVIDAITALISIVLVILSWYKIISYDFSNAILVYAVFINVLISVLHKVIEGEIINSLLFLSAMTYMVLILYAGFTLHKRHLFILGIVYITFYFSVTYYSQSQFIKSNTILVFVLLVGYLLAVHLIVQLLNKYNAYQIELIENLKKRNILLRKQGTELSNLNNTKDKLFSIIGHDLKTPVNSIMGFSELISMKSDSVECNSVKEFSKHIYTSSNMLNSLLDQLLNWARIQTGKIKLNLQTVKVNNCINDVLDLMKGSTYLKNITFERPASNDISIECDKQMILTVIRNLVTNALKYSPKNSNIIVTSEVSKQNYMFTIKDLGTGMDETTLDSLFKNEPLNSKIGTNQEKGSGLGLVICKEYINMHKGEIWAESELDKGSTFFFTIPL